MRSVSFKDIKGHCQIYANAEYTVVLGKKLWIFDPNFSLLICRPDICNAQKASFLSGRRLLIGQGKGVAYRLINLESGADIWSIPPIKMETSMSRFAIAADMAVAYDCFNWKLTDYLVTISLENGEIQTTPLQAGLRCTNDIACDKSGRACLLQAQHEEIAEDRIYQNGIRFQDPHGIDYGSSYRWKYKWQFSWPTTACRFMDSVDNVITNDLLVYAPKETSIYSLLENEPNWVSPGRRFIDCWLTQEKRYICIMYETVNVVIDRQKKKMVARYVGNFARGCLIDDFYYIASQEGIRKVAFPLIEDIPSQKYSFWKPGM